MGSVTKRCATCHRVDRRLHCGRLLGRVEKDVWVQRDRGNRIGWVVCKAGGWLCIDHPRLDASFSPTEAMTPSNPRWREFCSHLAGPEGCNFRKQDGKTVWDCKAGRDKTSAARILRAMGLSEAVLSASLEYFESHGGFCDCEILFNIADVHPRRARVEKVTGARNPA